MSLFTKLRGFFRTDEAEAQEPVSEETVLTYPAPTPEPEPKPKAMAAPAPAGAKKKRGGRKASPAIAKRDAEIQRRLGNNESVSALAKEYKLTPERIRQIKNKKLS